MAILSGRSEAENVIRKIRKRRNADNAGGAAGDSNARSLTRALDMLSTQLYTKATHFILELIQNADDNTYPLGVDPLLTLVYREDGYLWVGCNEVGFSKANVEALCDINDSTKKVKDATKGYIGEKGIGFKAVFKVADVVWVSSGPYTFRFDRDKILGMIVPVWCEFNSTKLVSERTMFCLRIPDAADRAMVKTDLLHLNTELLLFLRKLRRIDVRIHDSGVMTPSYGFSLVRKQSAEPQSQILTLARKDLVGGTTEESEDLFVSRMLLEGMPPEAKRGGIDATEIVMAFPTSPATGSQRARSVYNFLPIRTYGFPFLLQADFILTANREDIEQNNAWNLSLIDGALHLFVSAVRDFNRTGVCKYDWPKFFACNDTASGTIMKGLISRLRKLLQDENVLESQAGYLSRPSELMLVPTSFSDGLVPPRPLFDDPLNTFKCVSFDYSPNDLEALGMSYQTPQHLCMLLKWMSPAQLEEKSSLWHSRLAAGIAESDPSSFHTAKIIPLRDGEWMSATEHPFYLPNIDDVVDVPSGIEVKVISKEACADPARRRLYALLGARQLNESQICNLILDRHRSLSPWNTALSTTCLVSHAWYLFTYGSLGLTFGDLKLANELGQAVLGGDLYIQLPDATFRMKEYLPDSLMASKFVHPDYVNQGTSDDQSRWYKWLGDTAHVAFLPNFMDSRNGSMTEEFEYLIDHHPTRVWMMLVRDNWRYYSPAMIGKRVVGSISVQCANGQSCKLEDAYLATSALLQQPLVERYIPFVDVPDPDHLEWINLSRLGLRTAPDLEFYLTILQGVARTDASDVNDDTVLLLYKGIEGHSKEDLSRVKTAFTEEPLIPLRSSTSSSWRSLDKCRWNAPSSLTSIEPLSKAFPSCKELFVDTLEIPDAGAADVLDELCSRCADSSGHSDMPRTTIKDLLLTLSTYPLEMTDLDERFQRLARLKLVPVRRGLQDEGYMAFDDAQWFIPDRSRYKTCFEGQLWMLDFAEKELSLLKKLFDRMGLANRELSRHVVEETITKGEHVPHPSLTQELREKARYIALLVPDSTNRNRILPRLDNIQVLSSSDLVLRRHVTVNGEKIFGKDEKGRTVLQWTTSLAPQVFFSTESITSGVLPWHFVAESLSSVLGIPSERQALLVSVLYTRDWTLTEDFLERAGVLGSEDALALDEVVVLKY